MAAKLTQNEAVKYALSMVGKGYDYDNAYGWQCFDTANYYWHQLFGHGLKGAGVYLHTITLKARQLYMRILNHS